MSVLIVDDEPDLRESLRELLEEEGFAVATAADGAEALKHMDQNRPCLVILDLIMPNVSGNEVYARMQSDARLSSVPVVVSTSDPSRAPHGVPIMKKPINVERLLGAVRQHCSQTA
jgi:DNA-binding response OmpR family regulator